MKANPINKPSDLIAGDYVILVSWGKYTAIPAKIEKVAVKEIFAATYLNKMYGPGENGLGIEWDKKRWHFLNYGAWDLRKAEWGHQFPTFNNRGVRKLYRYDQLAEAELFAKVEVPKLQLTAITERMDEISNNYHRKIDEMAKLEEILRGVTQS